MKKLFTLFAAALLGFCAYAQDTEPCPSKLNFALLNADDPSQVEIELQLTNSSANLNGFNMQVTCDKDNIEHPIFKRVSYRWFSAVGYGTTILSLLDAPDDVKESMLTDFCDVQANYRNDVPCLVIIEILKTLDCRFFPVLEEPAGIGKFWLDFSNYEDGDYTLTAENTPSGCSFSFTGGPEGNRAWTADEPVTLTLTKNGDVITVKGEEPQVVTVAGNVTDTDNNPLEGVTVTLNMNDEAITANTDANGAYTMDVTPVEDATYSMTFEKEGYVTKTIELESLDEVPETVVLEKEIVVETITGIVTDANTGNALEGVNITLTITGAKETVATTTDAQGAYSLEYTPVENSIYTLSFTKEGYTTVTNNYDNASDIPTTLDVAMDKLNAISTIGVDSVNGRIYDLQGRELNSVPEHGIYIQNGKKYVK